MKHQQQAEQKIIRGAYDPRSRVQLHFCGTGRTKQAMKDECDINVIMAKYKQTGLIEFTQKHQPQYADVSGLDFQSSLEIVAKARDMFADLPASTRKEFNNDPGEMLDFVQDPDNRAQALEMGLIADLRRYNPDWTPRRGQTDRRAVSGRPSGTGSSGEPAKKEDNQGK